MVAQRQLPGTPAAQPRRLRPSFRGLTSIPQLFAFAFDRATERLSGADVATLCRLPAGALDQLDWVPSATISQPSYPVSSIPDTQWISSQTFDDEEKYGFMRMVPP